MTGECQLEKGIEQRRTLDLFQTGIESPSPNPNPANTRLMLVHKPHGVPTRESATAPRQSPLAETSGSDSVAHQRVLVGDLLNDEQRSDDLPIPSSHETTHPRIGVMGKDEPESR